MIIISIEDIISIILILFFIISLFILFIINLYKEKSKKWHNCFECKNYYCRDVSSFGGYRYDKCKITEVEDTHNFNDEVEYRKCKSFVKKEEE